MSIVGGICLLICILLVYLVYLIDMYLFYNKLDKHKKYVYGDRYIPTKREYL